jgi:Arc/MetJ-type ribon-helix-helix transcriptional regulator
MTVQIAVRLPDELAHFLDQEVSAGHANSRTEVISDALRREQRRRAALHDVEILKAAATEPDDLNGLATWATGRPLGLSD